MKKEDARIIINSYLETLGYNSVHESLHKNNYGKEVEIECNDLDRMNVIVNDLLNEKSYQEIAKDHSITAPRVNDIVANYVRCLKKEIHTQDLMLENYINETNINDEVNEKEFFSNYKKVLKGETPDKYYLFLPAESLDQDLTDTYATSLYDLLTNKKHKLNKKIEKQPMTLFNRLKEMYSTMDYDDRDKLENLSIIAELKSKSDIEIELDDRSGEEKLAEIEDQMKKLQQKRIQLLKKDFRKR